MITDEQIKNVLKNTSKDQRFKNTLKNISKDLVKSYDKECVKRKIPKIVEEWKAKGKEIDMDQITAIAISMCET